MAAPYSDIQKNLQSKHSDVEIKYEVDAINNSIANLLTISKGEIPGRPEVGSNLAEFLFEANDPITWVAMEQVIRNALNQFEPRIYITNISFTPYVNQNVILINIEYVIIRSGAKGAYSKTFEV